jgi:hypothetical protein
VLPGHREHPGVLAARSREQLSAHPGIGAVRADQQVGGRGAAVGEVGGDPVPAGFVPGERPALIWQALSGDRDEDGAPYRRSMVDDLRRRQSAGEIAADLDPAYLQLALFGAALAPTLLAHFAEDFTGLAADSPEFLAGYREQLRRLVAHLAEPL